jgi:4-amino-4-deoxy-L-arabinose transferase-like glycosyltransferase
VRRHLTKASWCIVAVIAAGLAVRLVFATALVPRLERRANVQPDPDHYAELAASLLDRGELGFDPPGASPTSVRGPAFPAWLAIGMAVGGRSMAWIAFWACVPGLIAAAAIAAVLARTRSRLAGLVGGLLCAAHPLACFVSARVLSDEFYGAVIGFAVAAWWWSLRSDRAATAARWAAAAGAFIAVAALTRVTAIAVLVVFVVSALLVTPRRIAPALAVVIVAVVLLLPWAWRTSLLVGRPALVESLAGYNFWLGESAYRDGFAADFGTARSRAHELMAVEAGTEATRSPEFWYASLSPLEAREFNEKLHGAALRHVGAKPWSYVKRCLSGLLWFWIRAETAARTLQYTLVALPLLAAALYGFSTIRTAPRPDGLAIGLIGAVVFAHVLMYAAVCPMARYSVAVYPLLCYLAGAGFPARPSQGRVAHEQPNSKVPLAGIEF